MRVTKVGDDLAVLLPKALAESCNLKEGDQVEVEIKASLLDRTWEPETGTREEALAYFRELSAAAAQEREVNREDALRRLREVRNSLPAGYKFDREEANAR
jgi:antitoxin MazE